MWNMYKVTTKTQNDVIDVVLIFSLLTFSSASTVDFEKINATRVGLSGSVYNSFFFDGKPLKSDWLLLLWAK